MTIRPVGDWIPHLLKAHGVDTVFGMPGAHSLPMYRELGAAGIRHVGVRHEQGAGFMADGYARASRRPGVALLISGPGVTNAATPLGQAYSDSVPLLLLTAAITRGDMGLGIGALHEITDQRAVTEPLTGVSVMALTPEQVPHHLAAGFARFAAARPRPVHLSVPLDVLEASLEWATPEPVAPSRSGPDPAGIAALARLLEQAERPVVLAGGGAIDAAEPLRAIVETTGALFVSTVAGKGILAESHAQSAGSTLQRLATRRAISDADLVIAIGTEIAEPDLYVSADMEASGAVDPALIEPRLALGGRFARIDIEAQMTVGQYAPDLAIVSDAALAARALLASLGSAEPRSFGAETARRLTAENAASRSKLERMHDRVLDALRAALSQDALVYADMTQIAYTGCITWPAERPASWHFPVGFGTLGYALPAAIGGKLACPSRDVVAVVGDGGLQFTIQELATAVELKLSLPVILWDNDALAEIADFMRARQIPELGVHPRNPDFAKLAEAYGAGYASPEDADAITEAAGRALKIGRPTLIHLRQGLFEDG